MTTFLAIIVETHDDIPWCKSCNILIHRSPTRESPAALLMILVYIKIYQKSMNTKRIRAIDISVLLLLRRYYWLVRKNNVPEHKSTTYSHLWLSLYPCWDT
jgi:hypothetical protein